MKLRQINENLMTQQMRQALIASNAKPGYVASPFIHPGLTYNPSSGHDSGARNTGLTMLPTGVPNQPRHRQFLGMQRRPGTIRL